MCFFFCLKINWFSSWFNKTLLSGFDLRVQQTDGGGLSCLTLATPWTVAQQAPLFMAFLRQEYWRGLPFPSPGDLPDPGIKRKSPALQADCLLAEPQGRSSANGRGSFWGRRVFPGARVPGWESRL